MITITIVIIIVIVFVTIVINIIISIIIIRIIISGFIVTVSPKRRAHARHIGKLLKTTLD